MLGLVVKRDTYPRKTLPKFPAPISRVNARLLNGTCNRFSISDSGIASFAASIFAVAVELSCFGGVVSGTTSTWVSFSEASELELDSGSVVPAGAAISIALFFLSFLLRFRNKSSNANKPTARDATPMGTPIAAPSSCGVRTFETTFPPSACGTWFVLGIGLGIGLDEGGATGVAPGTGAIVVGGSVAVGGLTGAAIGVG